MPATAHTRCKSDYSLRTCRIDPVSKMKGIPEDVDGGPQSLEHTAMEASSSAIASAMNEEVHSLVIKVAPLARMFALP